MGENKNSNSGILAKQKITMNETVREAIAQALIRLMKTTPFAQISISEIAKVAGVSRSSIYRNYDSKEQILHSHIHALYHSYFEEEKVQESIRRRTGWEVFCCRGFVL